MNKLIDYNSPEKEILLEVFEDIPFMDNWIPSLIENYIYSTVKQSYSNEEDNFMKYKVRTKYGLYDGEYNEWYCNGENKKPHIQSYYSKGELHGEYKHFWKNGQLKSQRTYINGNVHGECNSKYEIFLYRW